MEKIKVVVVVYNRLENLKRWLYCWSLCDQLNSELIIIHNCDNVAQSAPFFEACKPYKDVRYIIRPNVGYDIGAFQDVCKERMEYFDNDWQYLFWITDDTIVMRKDFLSVFLKPLQEHEKVGITCAEISLERRRHIRTSGFCIRKKIALRLIFPVDPVKTKQHCYQFEHNSALTLMGQVADMGYLTMMPIIDIKSGAVWDTGHRAFLKRWEDHYSLFPAGEKEQVEKDSEKILFICPIYNSYPHIISSLLSQTHKNWELRLIHDGPNHQGLQEIVESFKDDRIKYIETIHHNGNWGHINRQRALKQIKEGRFGDDSDYIVITNADNYHVPVFCEYYLKGFEKNPHAVAVFCDKMVHNYRAWDVISCRFERGYLDCAGVMIKKEASVSVGWRDIVSHSSDWTYFEDVANKYGVHNFVKIKGCLLIHN